MCLTIPKKVIEVRGDNTVVLEKPDGSRQEAKSIVELNAGDFCITQQNVAIEKIYPDDYQEMIAILNSTQK